MINMPQDNPNFSANNPFMTYYKNIISIIPLNQNQREIQSDPIIPDKLTSNSTLGNIRGNPQSLYTTIDGISSNSLGINDQTPCTVSLSYNKEIIIDFDYQVLENDGTIRIDEYYNYLQLLNNLNLQPREIFVFSNDGGGYYDNLNVYLIDQNLGTDKIINVGSNNFSKIILDHFIFMNTNFLTVPNIDVDFLHGN
jgi:hypothetical protein